ncbi:MAG TPA: hypothetical protein VKV22_13210 [Rhodanobacteraceae bacterium]|nr:hypothetical protein [Rhodanobacteraceae bacterium]
MNPLNVVIPGLPALFAGRTRLRLQEQTRTPKAAEGERQGWRESIQLFDLPKQDLDSGFRRRYSLAAAPE